MPTLTADDDAPTEPRLPLLLAAGLQDDLMVASNDLERLQRLLGDACDALIGHFQDASSQLSCLPDTGALASAMTHLGQAITAMQFQDMASQLVSHTTLRLRHCADRLARDTFDSDDADGQALVAAYPLRPNPVTQDEMDAGSIELF